MTTLSGRTITDEDLKETIEALVRIQFAYRYTAGQDTVCLQVHNWSGYSLLTGTQLVRIQFAYRYTAGQDTVCLQVHSWSGYSLLTGTHSWSGYSLLTGTQLVRI